jgi:hypothetical protein
MINYVAIPEGVENNKLLTKKMFESGLKLRSDGELSLFSKEKVVLPIYSADPTPFLADGWRAMDVKQVPELFEHAIVGLTAKPLAGQYQAAIFGGDYMSRVGRDAPIPYQMEDLSTLVQYQPHSVATKSIVQDVLLQIVKNPPEGHSSVNAAIIAAAYLGSYMGKDHINAYLDILEFDDDNAKLSIDANFVMSEILNAKENFPLKDAAIGNICVRIADYSPERQLQTIALAVNELTFDGHNRAIDSLAHVSGYNCNQHKTSPDTPTNELEQGYEVPRPRR